MRFSRLRLKMVRETRGTYGGPVSLAAPGVVAEEAMRLLEGETQEVVIAFFLNIRNVVDGWCELARGKTNECPISAKELVKRALVLNATGVVVAHNHPSGDPEPSLQDRKLTEGLEAACDAVDVAFLDHVVVGDGKYVSFKERGWLS